MSIYTLIDGTSQEVETVTKYGAEKAASKTP